MAFYLFNFLAAHTVDARPQLEQAAERLATGRWDIAPDSPHRDALAAGDIALIYVAAPDRVFIGRAELASAVQPLTASATHADRDELRSGVVLGRVDAWDPPVRMETVLARLGPSPYAKADFSTDVVRISPHEYQTATVVAAEGRQA